MEGLGHPTDTGMVAEGEVTTQVAERAGTQQTQVPGNTSHRGKPARKAKQDGGE